MKTTDDTPPPQITASEAAAVKLLFLIPPGMNPRRRFENLVAAIRAANGYARTNTPDGYEEIAKAVVLDSVEAALEQIARGEPYKVGDDEISADSLVAILDALDIENDFDPSKNLDEIRAERAERLALAQKKRLVAELAAALDDGSEEGYAVLGSFARWLRIGADEYDLADEVDRLACEWHNPTDPPDVEEVLDDLDRLDRQLAAPFEADRIIPAESRLPWIPDGYREIVVELDREDAEVLINRGRGELSPGYRVAVDPSRGEGYSTYSTYTVDAEKVTIESVVDLVDKFERKIRPRSSRFDRFYLVDSPAEVLSVEDWAGRDRAARLLYAAALDAEPSSTVFVVVAADEREEYEKIRIAARALGGASSYVVVSSGQSPTAYLAPNDLARVYVTRAAEPLLDARLARLLYRALGDEEGEE